MKTIDTPMPNHKVVSREECQGMAEELGTERLGDATFTSGLSRRAFLHAGAMAITATGLARAGMGRAIFGGMFASTLLTLFVVPVGYTLLDDPQEKMRALFKGKRK